MTKEQVLSDIRSLIEDIDNCTDDLIRTGQQNDYAAYLDATNDAIRLMVVAHQKLTCLYDHIKVLYGLKDRADELYFRVGALSASSSSTEAMRKAWNDYWHYVNYKLNRKGDKDGI